MKGSGTFGLGVRQPMCNTLDGAKDTVGVARLINAELRNDGGEFSEDASVSVHLSLRTVLFIGLETNEITKTAVLIWKGRGCG